MKTTINSLAREVKVGDTITRDGVTHYVVTGIGAEKHNHLKIHITGRSITYLVLHQNDRVGITVDDGLVAPSHVVVDTLDGFTFSKDINGELFTLVTARAFAVERNIASKTPSYRVFALRLLKA